jgi:hypothetical protein
MSVKGQNEPQTNFFSRLTPEIYIVTPNNARGLLAISLYGIERAVLDVRASENPKKLEKPRREEITE